VARLDWMREIGRKNKECHFITARCMTMVFNVTTDLQREQDKTDKSRSISHRLLTPAVKGF